MSGNCQSLPYLGRDAALESPFRNGLGQGFSQKARFRRRGGRGKCLEEGGAMKVVAPISKPRSPHGRSWKEMRFNAGKVDI